MAFHFPLKSRDANSRNDGAAAREDLPQPVKETAASTTRSKRFNTRPRIGNVREKIWLFQSKKDSKSVKKSNGFGRTITKDDIQKENDGGVYSRDGKTFTNETYDDEQPQARSAKKPSTSQQAMSYKSTPSRMILDKIWGNKKRTIRDVKRQADFMLNSHQLQAPITHFRSEPQSSQQPDQPISHNSRESLIWERLSRDGEGRSHISPQRSPERTIRNYPVYPNRARSPEFQQEVRTDQAYYKGGKVESPERVQKTGHRYFDSRSHKSSPERVYDRSVLGNGNSQSTARASDRYSSPYHPNSQSISDRNQSESLEEESGYTRRSSKWLPSNDHQMAVAADHGRHGNQRSDQRYVCKNHTNKDIRNTNIGRHYQHNVSSSHQTSVPNSYANSGSGNAPSFRQYRKVREGSAEFKNGRFYKNSHVTPTTHKHSSGHHRKKSRHRSGRGSGHRHWANGGIPHKTDEKFSTISRYWSIERGGGGGSSSTTGGSYGRVRRSLRERGQLFQDPDFPATTRSLSPKNKTPLQPIVWLRPHEICARPKFIAEGATRFDVERGESGDCWLLQAVSTLTLTPKFLDRVVPPDQAFDHTYCGIFRFRFWQFGEWVEVLVDDRLPTHKGRLVFLHSTDPAEFWAALLEKAYAKLYGSYDALHNGYTTRALQDLTGGIVQSFPLSPQDKFLCYQVLNSAVPRSSLLIACINSSNNKDCGTSLRLRNGLVTQQAYSITGLARVRSKMGEAPLVRLRNPWGAGEWTGPWSEGSWEWESLSDRDKELLSVRVRNEGEFWMGFDDFIRHFSQLDVVHVGPDDWMNEPALHSKKPWRAVLARRRWRAGYNAGGGPQYPETTSYNPQFHIQIPRAGLSKCHVVVSVTQQYETSFSSTISSLSNSPTNTISNAVPLSPMSSANGNNNILPNNSNATLNDRKKKAVLHPIGFAVYEVPSNLTRLTPTFVREHAPLDVTNYSLARETVTFFTLPPGDYMVVPHTQHPNSEGRFLLRILTDEQSNIWEVNEDNMVFRSVSVSSSDDLGKQPREGKLFLQRLLNKYPTEMDAVLFHKMLTKNWKLFLLEKPSLELAKSLVMLRDYNISGKLSATDAPPLLLMLQFWRTAFSKYDKSGAGKTSSYALRGALWEAGVNVSNKVLECLVLRFAKNRILTAEAFVMAMVRLHLAHERYHSIDTKMKGNPLSLEEMILMTIYS